ncbi:hypothetical protein KSP40_PGU014314 [Platanthera guangdongensis]|uniref:Sulfotransferase n=1 Tax=Platanthera guangdongensis TaxID=2320717 RepID=A0ABR2MR08_9ASPA
MAYSSACCGSVLYPRLLRDLLLAAGLLLHPLVASPAVRRAFAATFLACLVYACLPASPLLLRCSCLPAGFNSRCGLALLYRLKGQPCLPVTLYAIVSVQRSGSKWFEALLNNHDNIRSHGEIFYNVDRKCNMTVIKAVLDRVYSLKWNVSTFRRKKKNCMAAVGFKWMLNQENENFNNLMRPNWALGCSQGHLTQDPYPAPADRIMPRGPYSPTLLLRPAWLLTRPSCAASRRVVEARDRSLHLLDKVRFRGRLITNSTVNLVEQE